MQDPRTQYPQPKFEKQAMPAPGLAKEMDPKPDHGEESYRGFGRLTGRKALITGGDSGIGRAVAIAFAREGADVAINYLASEQSDASEVLDYIRKAGRQAFGFPGDLSNESFCKQLISDAHDKLGGLDILVNNAAHQVSTEGIEELTTEQFDQTFKTNVYSLFWMSKAALKVLPAGASIINTSSIQAYAPSPGLLDYATTKASIVAFSKSLAKQVAKRGIRVNIVAPGPVWTPLQPSGGQKPDKIPDFGAQVPMGRPAQPAELAPVYVLLASQESSYVTGETYGVTGGNPTP